MSWLTSLRRALSREPEADRLGGSERRLASKTGFELLLESARLHLARGLVGASLVVGGALLAYPLPLVMRWFVDEVVLGRRLDLLWVAIAVAGGLKLGSLAAGAAQQYVLARFEQDVIVDLQARLVRRTLSLPKSFFDDKETGYLLSRLGSDVQGIRWFVSGPLVTMASHAVRLVGGVVFLLYLQWKLALVLLVLLPALPLVARYFGRHLRTLAHRGMERNARLTRRLQETLAISALVKAFGTESREADRVADDLRAVREVSIEQSVLTSVAGVALGALPDLSRAVAFVVGAVLVVRGDWTLGSLLAFQGYLGYVHGPALALGRIELQLQGALAALDRVGALHAIVPEEGLGEGRRVDRLEGAIELRDVSFAYGGGEKILDGVSARVAPGEVVAVVGPSGVGKTTLVSLLLALYRPSSGVVLFDGLPASDYDLASLRARLGYVSQSPLLVSGSVLENLRYGRPDADMALVESAARAAGIHEYVAGLAEGYGSLVGERGVNLSEGQKQRLSLARALVREPDVLILDEPTSALDGASERSILDALPAAIRGRTCIVVTHRLATVERADRVLLLRDRRVVAEGTHAELFAREPYYRDLVTDSKETAAPPREGL